MPHIIVKLWPGRSEEQKKALAKRMSEAMQEVLSADEKSISIAIEEVPKENWNEEVYQPEIVAKENLLYKRPGY